MLFRVFAGLSLVVFWADRELNLALDNLEAIGSGSTCHPGVTWIWVEELGAPSRIIAEME